ncbi:MAG: cold-shock protein [Candidatus Omnitrophota bacterium]|nr:cold-shock protein [Candidatus Omnitrophota bacterium]
MARGKVKWYNEKKNYGFITTDDGKDVFVHKSALLDPTIMGLTDGQEVELEVKNSPKGLQAANVKVL